MQTRSRLFDDLARVANGALSAAAGVRAEIEQLVHQQFERFLADRDLVTREEFEAVEAMALKARREQADLQARIADLEAKLGEAKKTATKRKAASGDRRRATTTTATRRTATRKTKTDETPPKDE
ncbi:accessory factor UbiK family protein [Thalassobaculum sp. OXR-137]|uniref:accessory factor UbiK family protein n=1 Tax=Thalassobaculum sp. OXR-137 TaxID=3100173 RepID=UPI002AC93C49|nr:accessory factor UbiK family protein [Thalassobaculum sp. OXR-137]WPZ36549.1 accessory factor UbiK family protein [Thalassobaculum sp. OXR-137]